MATVLAGGGVMTTDELIEDVEWMLATGESLEMIAQRCGLKPGTLAKRLERAGRLDLSPRFNGLAKRLRQRSCVDCGEPCNVERPRCRSCGYAARRAVA